MQYCESVFPTAVIPLAGSPKLVGTYEQAARLASVGVLFIDRASFDAVSLEVKNLFKEPLENVLQHRPHS